MVAKSLPPRKVGDAPGTYRAATRCNGAACVWCDRTLYYDAATGLFCPHCGSARVVIEADPDGVLVFVNSGQPWKRRRVAGRVVG